MTAAAYLENPPLTQHPIECQFANDPKKCFEHHRELLRKVYHTGDPIKCRYCSFARPNAILAHKPDPDEEGGGYHHKGPPCPICGKPRPARMDVRPDAPCAVCREKTREGKAYAKARRTERDQERAKEQIAEANRLDAENPTPIRPAAYIPCRETFTNTPYKEMAHRIVRARMKSPRGRIVKVREVQP
jgi:hypothetical protein